MLFSIGFEMPNILRGQQRIYQTVMSFQVSWALRGTMFFNVFLSCHKHSWALTQTPGNHGGIGQVRNTNGHINAFPNKIHDPVIQLQIQFNVRGFRQESRNFRRDMKAAEDGRNTYTQDALGTGLQ